MRAVLRRLPTPAQLAGAEGLYPHADFLQQLLPGHSVSVLVDSGFFLDNQPFVQGPCTSLGACTEQGALQRGVPLWQSVVDASCEAQYAAPGERWKCMLGVYAAPHVTHARLFLMQFRFDLAQLGHDGIYHKPSTMPQQTYAATNAANVTQQVALITNAYGSFTPSCYLHTLIWRTDWLQVLISDASGRSVNVLEAFENGGHYSDSCASANCNPTCPTK